MSIIKYQCIEHSLGLDSSGQGLKMNGTTAYSVGEVLLMGEIHVLGEVVISLGDVPIQRTEEGKFSPPAKTNEKEQATSLCHQHYLLKKLYKRTELTFAASLKIEKHYSSPCCQNNNMKQKKTLPLCSNIFHSTQTNF